MGMERRAPSPLPRPPPSVVWRCQPHPLLLPRVHRVQKSSIWWGTAAALFFWRCQVAPRSPPRGQKRDRKGEEGRKRRAAPLSSLRGVWLRRRRLARPPPPPPPPPRGAEISRCSCSPPMSRARRWWSPRPPRPSSGREHPSNSSSSSLGTTQRNSPHKTSKGRGPCYLMTPPPPPRNRSPGGRRASRLT